MPAPKKTNLVSYEIKKLEQHCKELDKYLTKEKPGSYEDRIEYIALPKGGQMIKVIATKEAQLKSFMDALAKLPKIIEDLNRLRAAVDGKEEIDIRQGQTKSGFMQMDDDVRVETAEDDEEKIKEKKPKFEDDDEEQETQDLPKLLPPIETPPEEEDDDDYEELLEE